MCGADDCERCHPENAWPKPNDEGEQIHHPDFKVDCHICGGQGWYFDGPTDSPQQRQCESCNGAGSIIPTV